MNKQNPDGSRKQGGGRLDGNKRHDSEEVLATGRSRCFVLGGIFAP